MLELGKLAIQLTLCSDAVIGHSEAARKCLGCEVKHRTLCPSAQNGELMFQEALRCRGADL